MKLPNMNVEFAYLNSYIWVCGCSVEGRLGTHCHATTIRFDERMLNVDELNSFEIPTFIHGMRLKRINTHIAIQKMI